MRLLLAAACLPSLHFATGTDTPPRVFDIWQPDRMPELKHKPITSVVQTSDGYLWLGTYSGLLRFDGKRVVSFNAGTPGLANGRITSLYRDEKSVLWIGHETGELTKMKSGEFEPVPMPKTWPGGPVQDIDSDEHDDLWLLTNVGKLLRLRDGCLVESLGAASQGHKVTLSREKSGRLWISANGKVAKLVGEKLEPFNSTNQTDFLQCATPAQDGGMWVIKNGRLQEWREGKWMIDLGECPATHGFITELLETSSGDILAGTIKDGLYAMRTGSAPVHLVRTNELLHDCWVRSLFEDSEGNIWIGTDAGLNALQPRKATMLTMRNPDDMWEGKNVLSLIVRTNGEAWIGSEGAGLYHLDDNHWTKFTESSGLTNTFIWSILETRRGELYVGTWGGGLLVRHGNRFEVPPALAGLTAAILCLYEDQEGKIWIGTTSGLYRYASGQLGLVAGKDQLTQPDVRAIAEGEGAIWFGMIGGGLGRYKDGLLSQFRKQDGLPSNEILALYADPDGTLWIGTSGGGLCSLRKGKFTAIDAAKGLPAQTVSQIADDDAGNLWMGSDKGILRVPKSDLKRSMAGELEKVNCLAIGEREGLASENCSGRFQPSNCKPPGGQLWFLTSEGLAVIDPASVTTKTFPRPVVIEEFKVANKRVKIPIQANAGNEAPDIQIPPGEQGFHIVYTSPNLTNPDKVRFRCRLEGWKGWNQGSSADDSEFERYKDYTYLRPGKYTFCVTACNNDGVWNSKETKLSFRVLPHFWETWEFQAGSIVGGAGIVAAGVFVFVRRRERRKLELLERQRALERERSRIARDIHDDLGASLTRITLLSQSVRGELEDRPTAATEVDRIYSTARELTRAMDEIVWAVNPRHDTLDSLVAYLGRFAQNFLSATGIRCRLDEPQHLPHWTLTAEIRHNVFLAFKEALNNVVKHANASEVRVSFELHQGGFTIVIVDNGRGFDLKILNGRASAAADSVRAGAGNGLWNMRKRMDEIGSACEWLTSPGEGTRVRLAVTVKTHNGA